MTDHEQLLLEVENLSKSFGGTHALNRVSFDLKYGEVHALVGENGAGKSTFIKVVGGIHSRDEGTIKFEGQPVVYRSPSAAQSAGISIIHQELSVLPALNVMENLFMGNMANVGGILKWGEIKRQTLEALALVNLDVNPNAVVGMLTISQRQLIEIARALYSKSKLIIMDEPNSSLSDTETERLFELIRDLKSQGISIVYVSHKIEEVFEISDRITVFRDGEWVDTVVTEDVTEDDVINLMVGRELDRTQVSSATFSDEVLLSVRSISGKGFKNVSFDLYKGEILGVSGLIGAGRSEALRAIFGADAIKSGDLYFEGRRIRFRSPAHAIQHGLAMVPEDRKVLSLFMDMKIMHNMSMAELPDMSPAGIIRDQKEKSMVERFVKSLDIRLDNIFRPVSSLSGGNQQKTVLARWLATEPKLLILDEPTHGVDVGAKAEIYELIRHLAREGVSIILISSELPEILALSHRIVVMHEGRVTGIVNRSDASEENLMAYATGIQDDFRAPEKAS